MSGPSILVCRGCCCGTRKHPSFDHNAQVATLRAATPAGTRFWRVDCLGPCQASNVVVVRSTERRRWFGRVLSPSATEALANWISAGAPEPPPHELHHLLIDSDGNPVTPG